MEYKVTRIITTGGIPSQPQLMFRGTLEDLETTFPREQVMGGDLLGATSLEGGHVTYSFHFFQREDKETAFEACEDPRSIPKVMGEYARSIDEQNRRMFPGDFHHEEDDAGEEDEDSLKDRYDWDRHRDREDDDDQEG